MKKLVYLALVFIWAIQMLSGGAFANNELECDKHDWRQTVYQWAEDYSSCTASRTCDRCTKTETATDNTIEKKVTENTCEVSGGISYTADNFGEGSESWTVTPYKTGEELPGETPEHDWGETQYDWSADHKTCVATRSCKLNSESKETLDATVTTVITATCDRAGKIIYEATFDSNQTWAVMQTFEEEIDALDHSWGEAVYEWSDDYTSCTAKRICQYNVEHIETANGIISITHEEKPVSCAEAGYIDYKAVFDIEWASEQTKRGEGERIPHKFESYIADNNATCTENGTLTAECANGCGAKDVIENPNDPKLDHDYKKTVVKPTTTKGGYTLYTCSRCTDSYKDNLTAPTGHWYGEWLPEEANIHSAECKHDGCDYATSVTCERFEYRFLNETENGEDFVFEFCPICGRIEDAAKLEIVRSVEVYGENLPKGEPILRMGTLENGETILGIAFEYAGAITRPEGEITFEVPIEGMTEYTFNILNEDGTETELPFTADETAGIITLKLTFVSDEMQSEKPIKVLHLIPSA